MRKTLIQTLLAAFCAILATAPLEGGGVMLINMRNAMLSGGKRTPTAKDYVQDGLVAMWDGIENAGWGVHDANATTIVNLVAQTDPPLRWNPSNPTIGENYFACLGGKLYTSKVYSPEFVECVIEVPTLDYFNAMREGADATLNCHVESSSSGGYGILIRLCVRKQSTGDNKIYVPLHYWGRNGSIVITPGMHSISMKTGIGYIDGILRTNVSAPDVGMVYNYSAETRLVSTNAGGNTGYGIKAFCFRFYSRALTAEEIAANYAIDKARFNLPDAT